jgi:hypothetical protein
VFEKDQKKNSKPFRGHLAQNSVGGGGRGGDGKSGKVFEK